MQVVDTFTYLGSTLSSRAQLMVVNARIAKASAAFGRLRGSFGIEVESGLRCPPAYLVLGIHISTY